jgi:hypothetical protein
MSTGATTPVRRARWAGVRWPPSAGRGHAVGQLPADWPPSAGSDTICPVREKLAPVPDGDLPWDNYARTPDGEPSGSSWHFFGHGWWTMGMIAGC